MSLITHIIDSINQSFNELATRRLHNDKISHIKRLRAGRALLSSLPNGSMKAFVIIGKIKDIMNSFAADDPVSAARFAFNQIRHNKLLEKFNDESIPLDDEKLKEYNDFMRNFVESIIPALANQKTPQEIIGAMDLLLDLVPYVPEEDGMGPYYAIQNLVENLKQVSHPHLVKKAIDRIFIRVEDNQSAYILEKLLKNSGQPAKHDKN